MPTPEKAEVLVQEAISLSPNFEGLAQIQPVLELFWARVESTCSDPPGPHWRLEFATALWEIATNIIRHAHPVQRGDQRPVYLRLRSYENRIEARFVDYGLSYVALRPPRRASSQQNCLADLPESGLGLTMARAALDRLHYHRTESGANCWWLVKRLSVRH